MVDMYFYRDPEEQEKDQEEAALEERKVIAPGTGEEDFTADAGDWGADTTAATGIPAAAAGGEWETTADEWGAPATEAWDAAA
jgi:40S ribosomal protein SA C-terminus